MAGQLILAGCAPNQQPQAQRLVGQWQLMTQQQIDDSNAIDDPKLAARLGRESKRVDQTINAAQLMTIEFLAGAKLRTVAMQEKQGTWRYVGFEGSEIMVECQLGQEESVTTKIRFVDDDIICMIPPNIAVLEKELMFRRLKSNDE